MARDLLVITGMQPLTRSDVLAVVGDLDDQVIADVIATGADQDELELAVERLRDDTWVDREQVDPHVAALCDILGPAMFREDTEEEIYATD